VLTRPNGSKRPESAVSRTRSYTRADLVPPCRASFNS